MHYGCNNKWAHFQNKNPFNVQAEVIFTAPNESPAGLVVYLIEFRSQGISSLLPLSVAHSSQQTELELVLLRSHLVFGCQLHEGDWVVCLHCYVTFLRFFLWTE